MTDSQASDFKDAMRPKRQKLFEKRQALVRAARFSLRILKLLFKFLSGGAFHHQFTGRRISTRLQFANLVLKSVERVLLSLDLLGA